MTFSEGTRHQSRFRKLHNNHQCWRNASRFCDMFGSPWMKVSDEKEVALSRLNRVEDAIGAQKVYVGRAVDPDTRYRAEGNLIKLVIARNDLRERVLTLSSRCMR